MNTFKPIGTDESVGFVERRQKAKQRGQAIIFAAIMGLVVLLGAAICFVVMSRHVSSAPTSGVSTELVNFVRTKLKDNTASGKFEEIQWQAQEGPAVLTDLELRLRKGDHGAVLDFRSFDGQKWRRGYIAAVKYEDLKVFDWCGAFDGTFYQPNCPLPGPRNSAERAAEVLTEGMPEARQDIRAQPRK